jgi:endonuclease III
MRALGLDKSIFDEAKVPRGSPPASPASSSGRRRQGAPTPAKSLPSNTTGIESPLGLLEELFGENPWLLLMCTILLNRTRRTQVDGIFTGFLERWPTPEATLAADVEEICHWIMPLGIKGRRSRGILKFCKEYLDLLKIEREKGTERPEFHLTRSEIMGLFHCGEYAADAYQIFIQRDWTNLYPKDHALRAYVEWKRCEGI